MKTIVFFSLLMYSCTNVYDSTKNTALSQDDVNKNELSNQSQTMPVDTLPLNKKAFLENFTALALPIILEDSMFWNRKKIAEQEILNLVTCLETQKKSGVFEYGWQYLANINFSCLIYTRTIESISEDGIQEVTLSTIDDLGNCISNMVLGYNSDQRSCKIQLDKTKITVSQYKHISENHELVAVDIEDYEFQITSQGVIKKRLKTPQYRKPAKIVINAKGIGVIKIL